MESGTGLVGKADGRLKYEQAEAPWREKQRQDQLTELRLVVFRWGWTEAARPADLVGRLRRALLGAERLRRAGIHPAAHMELPLDQ